MNYVLLKLSPNYADEFDVYGFDVMLKSEFDEMCADMKAAFELTEEEIEIYFGTNEMVYFSDLDDVLRDVDVVDITQEEAKVFDKLFNSDYYQKRNADRGFISVDWGGISFGTIYENVVAGASSDFTVWYEDGHVEGFWSLTHETAKRAANKDVYVNKHGPVTKIEKNGE